VSGLTSITTESIPNALRGYGVSPQRPSSYPSHVNLTLSAYLVPPKSFKGRAFNVVYNNTADARKDSCRCLSRRVGARIERKLSEQDARPTNSVYLKSFQSRQSCLNILDFPLSVLYNTYLTYTTTEYHIVILTYSGKVKDRSSFYQLVLTKSQIANDTPTVK